MTRTVDVATSHTPLAELVSLALSGTEVVLTDGEKPVHVWFPIAPERSRVWQDARQAIQTSEDFDAPLPDEFWTGNLLRFARYTYFYLVDSILHCFS